MNFIDQPIYSDTDAAHLISVCGIDFDNWPRSLLPPATIAFLVADALEAYEANKAGREFVLEDHLSLQEQIKSFRAEHPIIRTSWGYLIGEVAPVEVDQALPILSMVGIARYSAGSPLVDISVQKRLMMLLEKEASDYDQLTIINGNEIELARIACRSVWKGPVSSSDAGAIQLVRYVVELLNTESLPQMIAAAIANPNDRRMSDSIRPSTPPSKILH